MKWFTSAKKWLKSSQDQNEYVDRSLTIDALLSLEKDPPDIINAKRRLHQLCDIYCENYHFVDPPEFLGDKY